MKVNYKIIILKWLRFLMFYLSYFSKIRARSLNANNYALPLLKKMCVDKEGKKKLPKIIWSYWHSNPPEVVKLSIDLLKEKNPDWEIRFLDNVSINEYLDLDFLELNAITHQQVSDVIRLELLYQYGGIWVDSSVLVFDGFSKIKDDIEKEQVDILGYYRKSNNTSSDMPVLENWFLASFKYSESINIWKTEFYNALEVGVDNYIRDVENKNRALLARLYDPSYLVCYVAFQSVLNRVRSYKLYDCDQSAFLYHITGDFDYFITKRKGWGSLALMRGLFINKKPNNPPIMIKLTSDDRNYFSNFYSKGIMLKDTLISEVVKHVSK